MCWQRGVVIISPFAQLHAFGTSNEACTFQVNWGPPAVISTRLAFLLGECATVSNLTGAKEKALDHRALQHQLDPPHPGVPGGGSPVAGDTPNLPLCLPQVLISWPHHWAPSHLARLVEATSRFCLSWHHFPDYSWTARGPFPQWSLHIAFSGKGWKTGPAL